jgi:SAM-dependent methyltransferase
LWHAVRTGENAFVHAMGAGFHDYLSQHSEEAALFDEVQARHWDTLALERHYDFSAASKVVDVGGGTGELLARLLAQHPTLTGVLVERPEVLARARARLDAWHDRVELHADFFEGVPGGGDIYLLAFVLHNWDDGPAVEILTRCREAMPQHARLLLIENLLDDDNGFVALLDLEMLIYSDGGRERHQHEYASLLSRAGLTLERTLATDSSVRVLEAVRVT